MKKSLIKFITSLFMITAVSSCKFSAINNISDGNIPINGINTSTDIIIGNEIIYGESFNFEDLFNEVEANLNEVAINNSARNINSISITDILTEDDYITNIYFSVKPTTTENLQILNEVLGYLNPAELDKEILQACDAEKLIFNTNDFSTVCEENISNFINFSTKYYYILPKEDAEKISNVLENFEIIEEFQMYSDKGIEKLTALFSENDNINSRGIFKNIANKIVSAIKTAVTTVKTVIVNEYEVCGTVKFNFNGSEYPAYGVNIATNNLGIHGYQTNSDGKFSLGKHKDIGGLISIWINYENEACEITNFLNVNASTLIKTNFPSALQNIKLTTSSGYANGKMILCHDILKQYEYENNNTNKDSGKSIPKARIWTTEALQGISSTPCFSNRAPWILSNFVPDIIITDLDNPVETLLKTIHHEYAHYLHKFYTDNKDNFWHKVVMSEISTRTYYDWSNPYVEFTENFADWYGRYSYYLTSVGADKDKATGYIYSNDYLKSKIFVDLVLTKKYKPNDILILISDYDIITFNELRNIILLDISEETVKQIFK